MTRTDPKPRSREVLVSITTALILGSTAVTGCAEKPAEPPKTTQTPPAPDQSPTPTPEAPKDIPKKVDTPLDSPLFQALPENMQKSYRSMDSMTLEQFKRLPREQQLQYTDLTYRMVENYVNEVLAVTDPSVFTLDTAQLQADLDNTDDDIIKLHDKRRAAALVMMTQSGDLSELDVNWKWRAKNYLVGLYQNPESQALQNMIDVIDSATSTTLSEEPYNGRLLMGYNSNSVVKDGEQTTRNIEFKSHYYQVTGNLNTFTYEQFTSLDGIESHTWSSKQITNV